MAVRSRSGREARFWRFAANEVFSKSSGKSAATIWPPDAKTAARTTTLRNSRTLPGQEYARSFSMTSEEEQSRSLLPQVVFRQWKDILAPFAQRRHR